MSEKARGAIFGVLGDIKGLNVLDVFAGSGALSIEAISRGASHAMAIEVDKRAKAVIQTNVNSLGIDNRIKVVRSFFSAWSQRHQSEQFDLIFADPPFDELPYRDLKVITRHLSAEGTLVICWPGQADILKFDGLEVVQNKHYGDAQLVFYQRIS